jgi:hypothetical protein
VFYITYFPVPYDVRLMQTYRDVVTPHIKGELNARGRKLFGIDLYDDNVELPDVCNPDAVDMDAPFSN